MATRQDYENLTRLEKHRRYFSETFKRKKVNEFERNLTTVVEISREYQVTRAAVYRWIYKYSRHLKKGTKQVIEMKSDTRKLQAMREKVKELEQLLGQKQVELEFHKKMVELASEEVGFDIKKKYGSRQSSGSGITGKNTKSS
jgi:transposase-like protein